MSWRSRLVEWGAILAVWSLFAAIVAGRSVLDPDRTAPAMEAERVVAWIAEYGMWAVVTPVVFWMCEHLGLDGRRTPITRVGLHAVFGLSVMVGMDTYSDFVWEYLLQLRDPQDTAWAALQASMQDAITLGFLPEFIIYLSILAVGFARAYYHRLQERRLRESELRAQLTEARLQALRMQVNPHFLFNTLNAVSGLVERDPRGVRTMVARLSKLLRHTLAHDGREAVTLAEELDVLDDYLAIMHVRFDDRLRVEKDIDPSVLDALVPDLIMQPLVENAIKHGIAHRETPGTIRLVAHRRGPYLRLRVEDDGSDGMDASPGLEGDGAAEVRPHADASTGVGLRNVRERLQQRYGDDHRVSLRPVPGGGRVAELWIPLQRSPPPSA